MSSSSASIESVLGKITDHNSDIICCILTDGEQTFHNLPKQYDLVDAEAVGEHALNMLRLMESLGDDAPDFDHLFLEYERHSLLAKKLDDGVLAVLNQPISRVGLMKMEVGLNLYLKPLRRALVEQQSAPAPQAAPPEPEPAVEPEAEKPAEAPKAPRKRRLYRGIEY